MWRAVLLPDKLPFNWRWVRWQYFLKLINSGIENTQIFDHTIFVLENISILWSCLMNEWKNLKKEISWFLLNIHCLIEFLNFDIDTFRKLLLQFYFTVLYLKMPSLSRNTLVWLSLLKAATTLFFIFSLFSTNSNCSSGFKKVSKLRKSTAWCLMTRGLGSWQSPDTRTMLGLSWSKYTIVQRYVTWQLQLRYSFNFLVSVI